MKRIGVLTSGGDSPGMNAAIRAVVRAAAHYGPEVAGIERGFQGLIDDQIRPLGVRDVGGIINRGGTILRSARCDAFLTPEGRAQAAATLRNRGIDGLVTIGGDGTYRGAEILQKEHGVPCVGVPGTIDNDIGGTEYTIGCDTAVNTALDAIDRLRDTAYSHDRVFFVEVMGRHNGYIAMMSGIAGGAEEVLVPETPTDLDALAAKLTAARASGKTSSVVVVAEGDEAGNAYQIAEAVKQRCDIGNSRVAVIGHLQRGGTPTAFDRILAARLSVRAVEALVSGESGTMAAIHEGRVVMRKLSDAWEQSAQFDPSYVQLLQILAR
jgi:6-phosphofructokinase 1